jgi:glycosyltransferase involved in cell wall biosynthesis
MSSISIAMTTYNGAPYIRTQLDSLAAQTRLPTELVIADDGSSDGTLSPVEDFARTAPFAVHIYRNPTRLGFRANFMHAIGLCKGDLISLCDQDDIWEPQKLERCVSLFDDPTVMLVYHNADVMRNDGVVIGNLDSYAPPQPRNDPLTIGPWLHGPGFTQVFRRTLAAYTDLWAESIDEENPEDRLVHDKWFPMLATVLGVIAYIHEPLAKYRQHGANTLGWGGLREPFLKRLVGAAGPAYQRYAYEGASAQRRAELLARMVEREDQSFRVHLEEGAARYQALADYLAMRRSAYAVTSFFGRMRMVQDLKRRGAYKNGSPWAFGRNSLLKDTLIAVPFGPFPGEIKVTPGSPLQAQAGSES